MIFVSSVDSGADVIILALFTIKMTEMMAVMEKRWTQLVITDRRVSQLQQTPTSETKCRRPEFRELDQPERTMQSFYRQAHDTTFTTVNMMTRTVIYA